MVRRDSLRRILVALDEKPGITSQGLAQELDISATAVNRHVSTLVEKGVVEHVPGAKHGRGYAIKNEYKELVAKAMKRLE
jgi:predicted ArsR family transcriptional regulator